MRMRNGIVGGLIYGAAVGLVIVAVHRYVFGRWL